MSLQAAKVQLTKMLEDADNKVIALSGKWGTGKSHLWREIQNVSSDKKVSEALYSPGLINVRLPDECNKRT